MSSLALNPEQAFILIKHSIWVQIDIDISNLFDTLSSHGEIARINHFLHIYISFFLREESIYRLRKTEKKKTLLNSLCIRILHTSLMLALLKEI